MELESLAYVDKQLTYHGFDQEVRNKVGDELSTNPKPVMEVSALMKQTNYATKQEVDVKYTLNLAVKEDKVYFNNYTATLADRELKVHIGNNKNITAKEAFNLLQDRSVYRPEIQPKEGEKFSAWVKVDFNQKRDNGQPKMLFFNQNYGYDLTGSLSKLDIKEMKDPRAQASLISSLEKGNLQGVTIIREGEKEQKVFIEAQPQYKSVNIYNQEGQKLFINSGVANKNLSNQGDVAAKVNLSPKGQSEQENKQYKM